MSFFAKIKKPKTSSVKVKGGRPRVVKPIKPYWVRHSDGYDIVSLKKLYPTVLWHADKYFWVYKDNEEEKVSVLTSEDVCNPSLFNVWLENKGFKVQAKDIFITCSDLKSSELLSRKKLERWIPRFCKLQFPKQELGDFLCSIERHKSGNYHYHLLLRFRSQLDIFKVNIFDKLFHKHPKIESVKNLSNVIYYIVKEAIPSETYYNRSFDWVFYLKGDHRNKVLDIYITDWAVDYCNRFADRMSTRQGFVDYTRVDELGMADYCLNRMRGMGMGLFSFYIVLNRVKSVIREAHHRALCELEQPDPMVVFSDERIERTHYKELWTLLRYEIDPKRRRPRSVNILIHGPTSTGKSVLLFCLRNIYPYYQYPRDGWFQTYTNSFYWFIYREEVGFGEHNFEKMFLGGDPITLNVKKGSTLKEDNPLVVMTSNDSLKSLLYTPYARRIEDNRIPDWDRDTWEEVVYKPMLQRIRTFRIEFDSRFLEDLRVFFPDYVTWDIHAGFKRNS